MFIFYISQILKAADEAARAGAQTTVEMKARRGRASYLGIITTHKRKGKEYKKIRKIRRKEMVNK